MLDFACGTGTFLLEVFQRIFENTGGSDSGRADPIVREHILQNLFGFEYLIAPYTIAHLKLSQFLKDKEHALNDDERLCVYLTNTLEPVEPIVNRLVPELTAETKAAQRVKETPILVITGNPPYSGHSMNKGAWITGAINEYKHTWERSATGLRERRPLGEKNPKWLQDDYVKFIRFAQMKMDGFTFVTQGADGRTIEHSVDGIEAGIVGVITNHSWLDNPTFRGMRQSLMRSFEQIYVLDLHGNAKKKERAPDGSADENVFDIEQGVAISLFVKQPDLERGVWRGDLWGRRLDKYRALAEGSVAKQSWKRLEVRPPDYLFIDRGLDWPTDWTFADIFQASSVGVVTGHDKIAVQFSQKEIEHQIAEYSLRPSEARDGKVVRYAYRPFDVRLTFYSGESEGFHVRPRRAVMGAFLDQDNLGLVVSRQSAAIGSDQFDAAAVTADILDFNFFRRGGEQVFPLMSADGGENLSRDFREFLNSLYEHHYSAEEILGFAYAVLHAPRYRLKYAELLRVDFPRLPFPDRAESFEALSQLGWGLVQAHLLRVLPRRGLCQFQGKGDQTVDSVTYSSKTKSIAINKTQYFKPMPQEVWDFHIGGYQVLDSYLKSRKGRKLTLDEINHVGAVADSLAFTIEQMAKIDEAYKEAFPDRG